MDMKIPKDYDGPVHTITTPDGKQINLPPGSTPFVGKVELDGKNIDEEIVSKKMLEGVKELSSYAGSKEDSSNEPYDPIPKDTHIEEQQSNDTPINPTFIDAIKVTKEELLNFYDTCIMNDTPFCKTYAIKGPEERQDVDVVLRTRTSKETSEILKRLSLHEGSGVDIVRMLNDLNLAASLVSIGNKTYDDIVLTLDERTFVIESMPAPKKAILWDFMSLFDATVEKLRKAHINF